MTKSVNKSGKPGTIEKVKADKFIKALRETRSVCNACEAIGIGRRTAYNWRQRDPAFAERWASAHEKNVDDLEASAMRRAIEGWDEPVFQNGVLVGHKRKYSDALTIFMLKANRKDKYFLEREAMEQSTADYWRRLQEIGAKAGFGVEMPDNGNSKD